MIQCRIQVVYITLNEIYPSGCLAAVQIGHLGVAVQDAALSPSYS